MELKYTTVRVRCDKGYEQTFQLSNVQDMDESLELGQFIRSHFNPEQHPIMDQHGPLCTLMVIKAIQPLK